MGQKVNPIGMRLGINRTWDSRWFANKGEYGNLLQEDLKIRKMLEKELKQAAVSKIVIERPTRKCRVVVHTARPGIVIGKNTITHTPLSNINVQGFYAVDEVEAFLGVASDTVEQTAE